ncbi:hypothetical protein PsYK624_085120 [Phanerochaete sordida]|uniref:Uncharacterized protein n=1 Tax=Phanerochaete sordida TaxID=48140 RepID=A0A9P3GAC6_9APHY|nr:hypothetical protein PsYK624_085120 [Phanerochaete sordida]
MRSEVSADELQLAHASQKEHGPFTDAHGTSREGVFQSAFSVPGVVHPGQVRDDISVPTFPCKVLPAFSTKDVHTQPHTSHITVAWLGNGTTEGQEARFTGSARSGT